MCQTRKSAVVPIAPAPAPPPARSTQSPAAGDISRVLAAETSSEEYTIQTTGAVEFCFAHLNIVDALIYVHGGATAGVMAAASGDCYIGRTPRTLTEIRAVGDENVPVLLAETNNSELQSGRTYVKGTAGDKVLMIYRTR